MKNILVENLIKYTKSYSQRNRIAEGLGVPTDVQQIIIQNDHFGAYRKFCQLVKQYDSRYEKFDSETDWHKNQTIRDSLKALYDKVLKKGDYKELADKECEKYDIKGIL